MKIEKIKKLKDKEVVKVAGQEGCRDVEKPRIYTPGQNCMDDCTATSQKPWYMSQLT